MAGRPRVSVPEGSINAITGDPILQGDALVNFPTNSAGHTELSFKRYYKNTPNVRKLTKNPYTRYEFDPEDFREYTAHIGPIPPDLTVAEIRRRIDDDDELTGIRTNLTEHTVDTLRQTFVYPGETVTNAVLQRVLSGQRAGYRRKTRKTRKHRSRKS